MLIRYDRNRILSFSLPPKEFIFLRESVTVDSNCFVICNLEARNKPETQLYFDIDESFENLLLRARTRYVLHVVTLYNASHYLKLGEGQVRVCIVKRRYGAS